MPLVLLTLVALQLGASSAKPKTDTYHQVGDRQPPQLSYSPFETALLKSLSTLESQQETRYREQKAADVEWWPPSPSWAVVYVTIAYVVVACFQWFTNVAKRTSRNVASWSWREGGCLCSQVARLHFAEQQSLNLFVKTHTVNKGQSAAWIVGGTTRLVRFENSLPDSPDYSLEQIYGPTPSPQDQRMDDPPFFISLNKNELDDFRHERLRIAIVGVIRYKDIFGEPHSTGICVYIRPPRPFEMPTPTQPVDCLMEIGGPPLYNRMT